MTYGKEGDDHAAATLRKMASDQGESATPLAGNLFDVGLQPERTALSWQRTTLALLAASAVVAKLVSKLSDHSFGFSFLLVAAVSTAVAWISWRAARRYRQFHATHKTQATGLAQGVLAGTVFALGAAGLVLWCVGVAARYL